MQFAKPDFLQDEGTDYYQGGAPQDVSYKKLIARMFEGAIESAVGEVENEVDLIAA